MINRNMTVEERLGNEKRVPILRMGTRLDGVFAHLFMPRELTSRFLISHDCNYRDDDRRCYNGS